jgi:Yqey-like protein
MSSTGATPLRLSLYPAALSLPALRSTMLAYVNHPSLLLCALSITINTNTFNIQPQLADEAKTQEWAVAAIEQTGAKGPSEMGKVMGVLMKLHKDEMDGKIAQKVVSDLLKQAAASA